MPELPEVETVLRGLEPVMVGQKIKYADVRRPDLRWPFPDDMSQRLTGATILTLHRRSKYILCDLDSGETLLIHLGMSGRMAISNVRNESKDLLGNFQHKPSTPAKHDHVILDMIDGARISFNDARRFGAMDLIETQNLFDHKLIKSLGPEPLGNEFNTPYLHLKLKGKSAPIKAALLDQRIVSGLGNIYVCESLWRAGINPKRLSGKINRKKIDVLIPIIRDVLQEAISAGGSSLKDHRQTNGDLGYFQHSFAVYGREGKKCNSQDCSELIKRIVQSGRSSFYCAKCQK
ncbi:bifunctional DNA-formamidopyrimidine glycosylase/DNA-(apurinic or apyrimidinic site) lyase [Amylibacter sp.]|nr:bifunctional DNA-formamidopyrimidine glycosylase/DNA-(apurinic or apyrimidinic site) lyase [Amylibacter sp.]